MLLAIPPDDVGRVWHIAKPLLEMAMRHTEKLDVESAEMMCEEGHAQLWLVWFRSEQEVYAAVLTDIQGYYNGRKVARIIGLGGSEFPRWGYLIGDIERWAAAEKCDAIEVVGRKGWKRLLPDYEPIEYVFSKELSNGQRWRQ